MAHFILQTLPLICEHNTPQTFCPQENCCPFVSLFWVFFSFLQLVSLHMQLRKVAWPYAKHFCFWNRWGLEELERGNRQFRFGKGSPPSNGFPFRWLAFWAPETLSWRFLPIRMFSWEEERIIFLLPIRDALVSP